MLENSTKYFEKVIGRKINNVELHKYYNYLLGTAFKRKNAQIFPFHNWDFTNMKYVIIGREYEEEKFCYFLYDSEKGEFNEKSQEEIKEILINMKRVEFIDRVKKDLYHQASGKNEIIYYYLNSDE